jgi:hypothetical protein
MNLNLLIIILYSLEKKTELLEIKLMILKF